MPDAHVTTRIEIKMHVGNTLTYIFLIMSHSQLVALDDFSNLHNYQNLKNIYLAEHEGPRVTIVTVTSHNKSDSIFSQL